MDDIATGTNYLKGNGCLGAVEAYGDDGVPRLHVLLGATRAGPWLSLVVGAVLALLALLVLLAHDGRNEGPRPGDPALVHRVVRPPGLHVELGAGERPGHPLIVLFQVHTLRSR